MASKYFQNFQECNGFPHDPENDYMDEFEDLADYLNWGEKAYKRNKTNFIEILRNHSGNRRNNRYHQSNRNRTHSSQSQSNRTVDDFDIDNFDSMDDYFAYFQRKCKKFRPRKNSPLEKFAELAKVMRWNNRKSQEWQQISRLRNPDLKEDYLCALFEKFHMDYDDERSIKENFKYLCHTKGWNDKLQWRIDQFNDVIEAVTEKKLSKLPGLQDMIRRYEGDSVEVPQSINKCQKYIKNNIFVNIYDFNEEGNDTQFDNVVDLSEYSYDEDKVYPKIEAKKDKILKVLLHFIRFGRH